MLFSACVSLAVTSKIDWLVEWFVLQKSAQTVRKLESEMSVIQRETEPILAKKPLGPTTSSLPPKLRATTDKIDELDTLLQLYNKK